MTKDLLLIFTRNPELGKCKTRLAATVGDEAALEIYKFLLNHTVKITENLEVNKQVHYSVKIRENDLWSETTYDKKQQRGEDLGERMMHAFQQGFSEGFERIIIIGSDLYDLTQEDLEKAFQQLQDHDVVIGPAEDGGYYILGMKHLQPALFQDKNWGTSTVLKDTLANLDKEKVHLLPEMNDVDYYEDIKDIEVFQPFLKHVKQL
ncbi:MAG: TIGR04282 family arsenosugar biosynthesis glycosyltransferase [Flavobacteriaceae bacterium]|nr:TIGR04282 family arsenosugar biosynthesis glycosyltransferase [Flavobacteriaceae bacterium]